MCSALTQMSEKEKQLMERYGITCVQKPVYLYKDFRYDNLNDALRYAETDMKRDGTDQFPGSR